MNKIEFGNCIDIMQKWIDDGVKVNTCVTSPPYYGLRDYGVKEQLGLEETPKQYIDNMVKVFSLVRELLTDDGTLWVNIGDSYSSGGRTSTTNQSLRKNTEYGVTRPPVVQNIKQKDLMGIPWMLAFALREDGWYLRQDIIWHKPNPMPESITDRCTKSHEYIFLLSKSPKYYYDNESIKEDAVSINRPSGNKKPQKGTGKKFMDVRGGLFKAQQKVYKKRNKRDVWTVNVKPYKEAHFAVFPKELIEPCIKAGCPDGGIVLDPFMGSGTTAQVAVENNKKYLGCELNSKYEKLQQNRIPMI